jgi:hypothetical protein
VARLTRHGGHRPAARLAKPGLAVQTPAEAAARLLGVIDKLQATDSGGFFNHDGSALPW